MATYKERIRSRVVLEVYEKILEKDKATKKTRNRYEDLLADWKLEKRKMYSK